MSFFRLSFRTDVRNLRNRRSLQRAALFGMTLMFAIVPSFQSMACFIARSYHKASPNGLISRTENIVLARAIKAEFLEFPKIDKDGKINGIEEYEYIINNKIYDVRYTFEAINLIKGKSQKFFIFNGYILSEPFSTNHFDHRNQNIFWTNSSVGRTAASSDCELHPSFFVGGIYLMFLDAKASHKSFELIRNYESTPYQDKWLSYVEAKVAEQQ